MDDHTSPRSKGSGGRLKPYAVKKRLSANNHWPLDEQAAAYILLFGESLGYWSHRVYTGHTISRKGDVWWLTVRATNKGKPEVTFVSGSTQQEAIKAFGIGLVYEQLKWKPDEFKPKA